MDQPGRAHHPADRRARRPRLRPRRAVPRPPMLPLAVFRTRQFSAANAVTFVVYGALGGTLFLLPVQLQLVDRYSALDRAWPSCRSRPSCWPSRPAPAGWRPGSGHGCRCRSDPSSSASACSCSPGPPTPAATCLWVLPAVPVFGAGLAITVAPLTATAMGAAPAEHAGVPRRSTTSWPGPPASWPWPSSPFSPASPAPRRSTPAFGHGFRIAPSSPDHLRGRRTTRRRDHPQPPGPSRLAAPTSGGTTARSTRRRSGRPRRRRPPPDRPIDGSASGGTPAWSGGPPASMPRIRRRGR